MRRIVHIFLEGKTKGNTSIGQIVLALANAQVDAGLVPNVWRIGGDADATKPVVKFPFETFEGSPKSFALNSSLESRLHDLPDDTIVHFHGGFIPAYYTISKKLEQSGKRIHKVLSPHGSYNEYVLRQRSIFNRLYYYLFERKLIRNASMIHLIGPTEINGFNFYMEKTNKSIVCLPDGEMIESSAKFPLLVHDGSKDPFVLTFSGSINIHEKGLDILLESLAQFSKEIYSPIELWVIGDGEDKEKLKHLVKSLDLEQQVKFLGDPPIDTRKQLLQQSHVFVHPSRNDVIPNTLLEAASIGLPLIVTEETNLGAFVRQYESGWCLERNSVEGLVQALHEAYVIYKTDDESYSRLNRNSFKMIREALNWNTLAKKWKEVYASFL